MIPTLSAETSRIISRSDLIIFEEIVSISRGIINQSIDGLYELVVTNSTTMTSTQTYFDVWTGVSVSRPLSEQMNSVIQHFEKLGYTITRQSNTSINNRLNWLIQW